MVAGNVARVIRAPGQISIGPTDLSTAGSNNAYGGTLIGKTNGVVLQPMGTPFRVESEALGEATDILEPNKRWVFSCFVRGWDDDAVEKMFSSANYAAGGTSQHAVYSEPGTRVPGESAIGRAVILLYVPDDIIHVPALLLYRGIPEWAEGGEVMFQRGQELGIPLTVDCLRDGNGNLLSMGRISDLSLT